MRTLFLIKLFILSGIALAYGQIIIVPKIGLSLPKITDNSLDAQSSRPRNYPGYSLGVSFHGTKKKPLAVSGEILFIQKGFKIDETPGNGFSLKIVEKLDMRVNYLQFPIIIRWYPTQSQKFWSISGLYFARALGGRYSYYYENSDTGLTTEINDKKLKFSDVITGYNNEKYSITNKDDMGIQLGFGFRLLKKVEAEFSYMSGFSSVSDDMLGKPKDRTLSITIGFPITL